MVASALTQNRKYAKTQKNNIKKKNKKNAFTNLKYKK